MQHCCTKHADTLPAAYNLALAVGQQAAAVVGRSASAPGPAGSDGAPADAPPPPLLLRCPVYGCCAQLDARAGPAPADALQLHLASQHLLQLVVAITTALQSLLALAQESRVEVHCEDEAAAAYGLDRGGTKLQLPCPCGCGYLTEPTEAEDGAGACDMLAAHMQQQHPLELLSMAQASMQMGLRLPEGGKAAQAGLQWRCFGGCGERFKYAAALSRHVCVVHRADVLPHAQQVARDVTGSWAAAAAAAARQQAAAAGTQLELASFPDTPEKVGERCRTASRTFGGRTRPTTAATAAAATGPAAAAKPQPADQQQQQQRRPQPPPSVPPPSEPTTPSRQLKPVLSYKQAVTQSAEWPGTAVAPLQIATGDAASAAAAGGPSSGPATPTFAAAAPTSEEAEAAMELAAEQLLLGEIAAAASPKAPKGAGGRANGTRSAHSTTASASPSSSGDTIRVATWNLKHLTYAGGYACGSAWHPGRALGRLLAPAPASRLH